MLYEVITEHLAGATEADRDFVGDVVDRQLVAQRPQLLQVAGRVDTHPGGGLHQRLDDDPGDLPGVGAGGLLEGGKALGVAAVAMESVGAAETIGPLGLKSFEQNRLV